MIFLLRHGQIHGYEQKRYIGVTDICLDFTGVLQAYYWKRAFKAFNISNIYSSSLKRCKNTAQIIANPEKIISNAALNEINMGKWDGKTFDQIKENFPKEFENRGKTIDTFEPENGESFYKVHSRAIPFFNDRSSKGRGENTLIVAHAGVIRVILCDILNIEIKDLFQIKLGYSQLFVIQNSDF
ncbi:MAG: histidine phosphatase family protein [Desulfobacteraceae bacterium]|nr:histidine phosphatase family protein [Desulfobacteraceae bacterium]